VSSDRKFIDETQLENKDVYVLVLRTQAITLPIQTPVRILPMDVL
tara:strand:+ start:124 stop:258 length:135 start_codon:yes stop_codon:yes gene_type:complete